MQSEILINFADTQTAFTHKSTKELKAAYRLFRLLNMQALSRVGQSMLKFAFQAGLPISAPVKATLFRQFCGGETLNECTIMVKKLHKYNMYTVLDYSVENTRDEEEIASAMQELINTIVYAAENNEVPFSVFKATAIARMELLGKVSEKAALTDSETKDYEKYRERFERLCEKAHSLQVPLFVDAEETWIQQAIDEMAREMMEKYNRERPIVFNTYQMYRKDRLDFLKQNMEEARAGKYFLGVKLVRGAYMEKERGWAEKNGHGSPIHETKLETDEAFNAAIELCISNIDRVMLCCASHNEYSCQYLAQFLLDRNLSPNDPRVWFSQLYGMCDHISFNLAQAGYNVAKYVPYGPVKAVVPYLIRRAEENSSVTGQSHRELQMLKLELERRRAMGTASQL
ncbi:MAG: proline dehydrogenase family protein [Bacteroidia bacterium]